MNEMNKKWYSINLRQLIQGLGGFLVLVIMIAGGYIIYELHEKIGVLQENQANQATNIGGLEEKIAQFQGQFTNQKDVNNSITKMIEELDQKIPQLKIKGDKIAGDANPKQWVSLISALVWSDYLLKNGGEVYHYKQMIKNLANQNTKFNDMATDIGELRSEIILPQQILSDQYLQLLPKIDSLLVAENREHPIVNRLFEWIRIRHVSNNDVKSLPITVQINHLLARDKMAEILQLLAGLKTQYEPYTQWHKQAQLRAHIQKVQSLILSEITDIGAN